jgi:transmembrane sensor
MGEVIQLFSAAEIEEQASHWLSRLDRGLDPSEQEQLSAWLKQDARNGTALVSLARDWDDMESLRSLSGLIELRQIQDRRNSDRRYRAFAIGAVASFAVLVGALIDPFDAIGFKAETANSSEVSSTPTTAFGVWTTTLATSVGERQTANLPDGSLITLNTRTKIHAATVGGTRHVDLVEGEATFSVAHDPVRPFIVVAAGHEIRAVGTKFNVRRHADNSVSVIVTEGKVAFGSTSEDVTYLVAGERVDSVDSDHRVTEVSKSSIDEALAWHHGSIVFQGETLTQALEEISRYSDTHFLIEDPSVRTLRIAGVYRTDDMDAFLASLRSNLALTIEHDRDSVRISRDAK